MRNAQLHRRGAEQELAALNAKAEALRMLDADDWADAELDTALECARFRDTRDGSISVAVDPDGI